MGGVRSLLAQAVRGLAPRGPTWGSNRSTQPLRVLMRASCPQLPMELPPPPPPPKDLPSRKSRARKLQRQRAEARFTHKLLTILIALETNPGSGLSRRGAALQDASLCINSPCHGAGSHFSEFDTSLFTASDVSITSDSHRFVNSPCQDASSPLTDFDTIVPLAGDVSITSANHFAINSPCRGVGSHFSEIDTNVSAIHASTSSAMRVFINSPCQGVGPHLADWDTIVFFPGDTSTISLPIVLQTDPDTSPAFGKTRATSLLTSAPVLLATSVCSGQQDLDEDLGPSWGKVQEADRHESSISQDSCHKPNDLCICPSCHRCVLRAEGLG